MLKKIISLFMISAFLVTSMISCTQAVQPSDSKASDTVSFSEETNISTSYDETSQTVSESESPIPNPDTQIGILSEEVMKKVENIYDYTDTGKQTVTTVQQLAILTSVCASIDGAGPISVTPALLNGEEVTLMTLGGTQDVKGQATSMKESALASFGKQNDYLTAVENLIENGTVPENKPLLVTGISLGGMIAQQLTGKTDLLAKHGIELKQVICFGSPFVYPTDRNGIPVIRFTDQNDAVPKMGESTLLGGLLGRLSPEEKDAILRLNNSEKIVEESHYSGLEAHALSYISESCWDKYDFMGSTEKNNVLILQDRMTFYPAPTLSHD